MLFLRRFVSRRSFAARDGRGQALGDARASGRPAARRRGTLVGCAGVALSLALGLAPAPARALESLDAFLVSARTHSFDTREAKELAAQRSAELMQAWGRMFPSLTARGSYTRNQFPIEVTLPGPPGAAPSTITITPADQLDATFTAEQVLVDVSTWLRIGAATDAARAADVRVEAVAQDVERAVAQRYYQVVGAEALVDAATRSLAAAEEFRRVTAARRAAGAATELDMERALAEVERARQSLADAELLRTLSRNALATLSGMTPGPGGVPLSDDLAPEAPLAQWLGTEPESIPLVRAAALEKRALDRSADAAAAALAPVVSAQATERLTNASGFAGREAVWAAGFVATWRLDVGIVGAARAQSAAARAAAVREQKARVAARDRIHDAWHQVNAAIAKSRAARVQAAAAAHAAKLARERYGAGAATQLELIQAERDAFGAEVQRIQSDADLAVARALLRLSAGKALTPQAARSPR